MNAGDKLFYKSGEVSELLNVPLSTLRFWESQFTQLAPKRTAKGTRLFSSDDIEVCRRIKFLLRERGCSVAYARKQLDDVRKFPPRNAFVCNSKPDALRLLDEAKSRSDDAHLVMRISAVELWIQLLPDIKT